MVVIFEGNETERLQYPGRRLSHRLKNLGHAVNGTGLRLKREFDERPAGQSLLQA